MTAHTDATDALGIDLGGTKIEALRLAPDGRELWRQRVATPADSYDGTLAALAGLVQLTRQRHGSNTTIGIGSPGTATAAGLMKNCNSTCLNGRPLQHDLQALLGQPVALGNDANCLALSEATDGAGAGAPVVFAVILGTGCGGGIAVHGQVLTGPNGLAGEWGHNPLPWTTADDPRWPCYCGQQGCLETLLSGTGMARDHALHNPGSRLTAAQVAAAAAAGDVACSATLERHAHRLARGLAGVINLLDPHTIVLGGGLSRMQHLYSRVPQLWSQWVFAAGAQATVQTRLLPAQHGDASGVRGAAWLGRQLGSQPRNQLRGQAPDQPAKQAQAESAP